MAVVKESSISYRIVETVEDTCRKVGTSRAGSLFSASEIMGCPRKAILDKREGRSWKGSPHLDFRYAMHRSDLFEVIDEDLVVSSMEIGVECKVDMLIKHCGEHVIIMISDSEKRMDSPITGDVVNMVAAMYSSGIWSGILAYHNDGEYVVFFLNPDRSDAKRILTEMVDRGKTLRSHEMSGTIPGGESCEACIKCPHAESCPVTIGATDKDEDGEETDGRRDRQEKGERAGT